MREKLVDFVWLVGFCLVLGTFSSYMVSLIPDQFSQETRKIIDGLTEWVFNPTPFMKSIYISSAIVCVLTIIHELLLKLTGNRD